MVIIESIELEGVADAKRYTPILPTLERGVCESDNGRYFLTVCGYRFDITSLTYFLASSTDLDEVAAWQVTSFIGYYERALYMLKASLKQSSRNRALIRLQIKSVRYYQALIEFCRKFDRRGRITFGEAGIPLE